MKYIKNASAGSLVFFKMMILVFPILLIYGIQKMFECHKECKEENLSMICHDNCVKNKMLLSLYGIASIIYLYIMFKVFFVI